MTQFIVDLMREDPVGMTGGITVILCLVLWWLSGILE